METKKCTKCGVEKSITAFYWEKSRRGYRPDCKECVRAAIAAYTSANPERVAEQQRRYRETHREEARKRTRQWRLDNPEKYKALNKRPPHVNRAWSLKQKFGLTLEQYAELFAAQGGVCAICREPETSRQHNGKVRQLAVDHDHVTDVVRGLLCCSCNRALGYLRDNPTLCRAAAEYLEKSQTQRLLAALSALPSRAWRFRLLALLESVYGVRALPGARAQVVGCGSRLRDARCVSEQ